MAQQFDRQKLLTNISTLIQQHGYKVGELETSIGVSQGYLSRLTRGENTPSAELIWKLAKLLDVNMELLIDGDFSNPAPNIEYVQKFARKLLQDTLKGELIWSSCSIDDINASLMGEIECLPIVQDMGYVTVTKVPIDYIRSGNRKGSEAACGNRRVCSFTRPRSDVIAADSYFWTDLKDRQRLYVFKFAEVITDEQYQMRRTVEWYELVFGIIRYEQYDYEPLANTLTDCPPRHEDVEALYQELKHHEGDLHITENARSIIDGFMKSSKSVEGSKSMRKSEIQIINPGINI